MRKNSKRRIMQEEPIRRLSLWRVMLALFIVIGGSVSMLFAFKWWQDVQAAAARKPWFAAYVDVTAKPTYDFEQLGDSPTQNAMLAFIVSSPTDPCTPTWGATYTLDDARGKIDLDRRIARLRQQGGNVAISFGGLLNDELALKCTDPDKLYTAYKAVIDRYSIDTIDLDLENKGLTDIEAAERRAQVIATLQADRRHQGKSLAVWLTLPVAPQGLTSDGTNAVAVMLKNKVDIAGVNVMTMNYGASRTSNQSMAQASQQALNETHRQLGILYKQAGITLSSATLWKKIGATPMIGQNDVPGDVFTLDDATNFNTFTMSRGVGRMSMWSVNRDLPCGDNYVNVKIVSDSCSGVKQDKGSFSVALSKGFDGDIKHQASVVTTQEQEAQAQTPDDPAKSPYQIWAPNGAYLAGTKVVWHHNVYVAKWWTQNDMPDNPVLQSWQTPWQLVGPVLPGEKPIKQLSLPEGTYAEWAGDTEYQAGDRVLFNGIPFQAKWWNKGDSPAASAANVDNSPWTALTQEEIEKILSNPKN
jgi:chitinase